MKIISRVILLIIAISQVSCEDASNATTSLNEKNLIKVTGENFMDLLSKQANTKPDDKTKPLFLFFMNRDCNECWDNQKEWIRLSTIANKNFDIARTDCHFDHEVCQAFRIDKFPFILFFKENKIYRYSGPLQTQDFLEFLSGDNFKTLNSKVYESDLREFYSAISGTTDLYNKILRVSNDISRWCELQAKAYGKTFGVSHWSDNSKMVVFSLIALGYPTVFLTFAAMWMVVFIQTKITYFMSTTPDQKLKKE